MANRPVKGAITVANVFQLAGVASATVALVAGQWGKLGELIGPAGLKRSLGYGMNGAQSDAVGRLYCKLNTSAPAEVTGRLRIQIYSPQDRPQAVLGEWHSSSLDQNVTDRTKWFPLPEMPEEVGRDFKFVFEFNPDSSATVTKADSVIYIDTTEQLL